MEFSDPEEQAWYNSRPPVIQRLIEQVPPHLTYWLRGDDTGDYYEVYSYSEGGTVTAVRYAGTTREREVPDESGKWISRLVTAGTPLWKVFGIAQADLTPRGEQAV